MADRCAIHRGVREPCPYCAAVHAEIERELPARYSKTGHTWSTAQRKTPQNARERARAAYAERQRALKRGEQVAPPRSYTKLTAEVVSAIRDRVAAGEQQKRVALDLGLSPTTVNDVVHGRRHAEVSRVA